MKLNNQLKVWHDFVKNIEKITYKTSVIIKKKQNSTPTLNKCGTDGPNEFDKILYKIKQTKKHKNININFDNKLKELENHFNKTNNYINQTENISTKLNNNTENKKIHIKNSMNLNSQTEKHQQKVSRLSKRDIKKINIQSTIDLHFFTLNQAEEVLYKFLYHNYYKGKKHLLVITGGNNLRETKIRSNFIALLNKYSNIVYAYSQASIKDGGQGAYYVILKSL